MAKKVAKIKKAVKKVLKKVIRKPKPKITKILVHCDCGFHNHLTVRGEGADLSWHHGRALENQSANLWTVSLEGPSQMIEFKVLLNDQVFEIGDNHKVKKGQTVEVHPKFH